MQFPQPLSPAADLTAPPSVDSLRVQPHFGLFIQHTKHPIHHSAGSTHLLHVFHAHFILFHH